MGFDTRIRERSTAQGWIRLDAILLGIAVFAAALGTRTSLLTYAPIYDEIFHLLAGQSWAQDGTFSILDGEYTRGSNYTVLVGIAFALSESSSAAIARFWTAAIPGSLFVVIWVLWTRNVAGSAVAMILSVPLILWPTGIEVSQFARFYSLQGLLFTIGAIGIYSSFEVGWRLGQRMTLGGLAVLALALATDLQVITLVGVAGISLWVFLFLAVPRILSANLRWKIAIFLTVALLVVTFLVLFGSQFRSVWRMYQSAPPGWNKDIFYYHRTLRDSFPTFWPLYPAACLVALTTHRRLAGFAICIFVTSVIIQSFGIRNDMRYLYQSMPFFFLIWALALQATARGIFVGLQTRAVDALSFMPSPARGAANWLAVIVVLGFAFFSNAAFHRSVLLVANASDGTLLGQGRQSWPDVQTMVEPWEEAGVIILTTHPMTAAAEMGDFDVVYNESHHWAANVFNGEADGAGLESPIDPRHGRPVIGSLKALTRLVACMPVGVLVTHNGPSSDRYAKDMLRAAQHSHAKTFFEEGQNVLLIAWRSIESTERECGGLTVEMALEKPSPSRRSGD